MRDQRAPVPGYPQRPGRRGNSGSNPVVALHRFTTGGQAEQLDGDPRYPGAANDDAIRRDRTAYFARQARSGVGTVAVDWTAAGPTRPELHSRNVTVRTMAGTSRTRALANPLDPRYGLHSRTIETPRGNIARYRAGVPTIRPGRTDRLSPARYTGQSYSQTTLEQGARR